MLKIEGLSWNYGTVQVLKDLDFQASPGEILGILGENGAGKSTLLRLLAGITISRQGRVSYDNISPLSDGAEYRSKAVLLPEGAELPPQVRVGEWLTSRAALFGCHQKEIAPLLEIADLQEVWKKPMGKLSRGFRQRVGLVQVLMQHRLLWLLDEPFSGLDPRQILKFRSYLQEYKSHRTIIFSSHILPEVYALCDRILILGQGQIQGLYQKSQLHSLSDLEQLFNSEEENHD